MPRASERPHLVHDILRQERGPLDAFFSPRNVAVIGATETPGSVGRTILWNLLSNPFGGTVFPVNPKRPSVLGVKAYPSIDDVPAAVDLAVVVTPAASVPAVIERCAAKGVGAAIVISAGFKELGPEGAALEAQVRQAAGDRLRIIGPNCLGVMSPPSGLNATFAAGMARPGQVAFLSQSGALLTGILDWSMREQVGFSAFVSVGSMLDVSWGDLIDHFGDDPRTRAILIYMESVGDARSFLSAAREVALRKPIIVIKPGRTEAAARAAVSHTGALAGSDEVLDAAFRRCGVLRVSRIGELFSMAEVLARQPTPRGPRLTIVTNAGGPGVLATDALIEGGGQLAPLAPAARDALSTFLPAAWSHGNPVDVLGDAGPDRYGKTLEVLANDPQSDGLLVVLTPQDMTDPTLTAERLSRLGKLPDRPLLASWMGGALVQAGVDILNRAGVPTFDHPDAAASAFCAMWRRTEGLRALYETPVLRGDGEPDAAGAEAILSAARAEGRQILDEEESKRVLAAYGIPVVPTGVAATEDEAAARAAAIGFPVVCKLRSRVLTHKTDVGGVKLGLADGDAVVAAFRAIRDSAIRHGGSEAFDGVTVQPMIDRADGYELICGLHTDPQFGPVLLFGAGGQLVEVMRDRAIALPPLTSTLARDLIMRTRISGAFAGVRGRRPVDVARVEQTLVALGRLALEQPLIREVDVNPLVAGPDVVMALDARVVLHPADVPAQRLPRPAIRSYPAQYVSAFTTRDGREVLIRPIRPEDEPLLRAFHRNLSEHTVRLRYLQTLALDTRTAHERLARVCFADYDRELPLVVEASGELVAVGRLSKHPRHKGESEFALLVADEWQARGLGTELLRRIIAMARAEGMKRVSSDIMRENTRMQRVCARLGFNVQEGEEDVVTAVLEL